MVVNNGNLTEAWEKKNSLEKFTQTHFVCNGKSIYLCLLFLTLEEKYPKTIYFSRNCATVKFLPQLEDYK